MKICCTRAVWEHSGSRIRSIVPDADFAILADDPYEVDPDRIAFLGISMGGYYAPRGAAFEHRVKAPIATGARF